MATDRLPGSFRDPSGYLFRHDGLVYRRVNHSFDAHYQQMIRSGFYQRAVEGGLLVSHEEIEPQRIPGHETAYKVLQPEQLPFISYPYEWCFHQLKDAALLTLELQKLALDHGLGLKDASAFNVQFHNGRPVFIDTLSFESYEEGQPWVAYQQFCMHFLAPLALMTYCHPELNKILRQWIGGIPLDLASRLLPTKTKFRFGLLMHIHMHARSQHAHADRRDSAAAAKARRISKAGLLGIIDSLRRSVDALSWQPRGTEWGDYYDDTNYSSSAEDHKAELVAEFVEMIQPRMVWDLGANTGRFSRICSERDILTVAADIDPAAVDKNYQEVRKTRQTRMLPLVMDLTNPTPALGWSSEERMSLTQRGPVDMAMALALVHHLAISNNVPLPDIARYFRSLCQKLIVEFIPKPDSQVKRLLSTREDIFHDYTEDGFVRAFETEFSIERRVPIRDSERILYCMVGR